MDCNGQLSASDSLGILRVVGQVADQGTCAANPDFDGNGTVETMDVLALLFGLSH
jgi:hypothetical protein